MTQELTDVEKFFLEKPHQYQLFQMIEGYLKKLGQITIRTAKTQVSFAANKQFAWIWFPMEWDKRNPTNAIVLSFSLGKPLDNPRIAQVVKPHSGICMHHVMIKNETDFNRDIQGWLKQAFDLGSI